MNEVHQTVENSHIENMAGRDINITVIHGNVKPFPRAQYVRDILQLRSSCKHLEFIINTHAEKCYGSRFFKEMTEEQLTEMYQFVMQLQKAVEKRKVPSILKWVLMLFKPKSKDR